MSNQPDQTQPHPGHTTPGYMAPPTPQAQPAGPPYEQGPYDQGPYEQGPYGQNPYGAPSTDKFPQQAYQQPQFAAPAHFQGGPGYVDPTSGPRGMSLASMIIGLASLFVFGFLMVPQIVGIVLGHIGLRKENPQGMPFSITGLITNYLALAIWGGLYLFALLLLGVLVKDADTSTTYSALVHGL